MKIKKQSESQDQVSPAKKAKFSKEVGNKTKHGPKSAHTTKSSDNNAKFNAKSQKPPYDKVKNMKNAKNVLQEKPADWNLFKKEKKELRQKRKASRGLIDVITEAKQIGEKMRLKSLEGGAVARTKLVNELHELMGNQGNYVKFVLTHDMARIVQYLVKFCSPQIRAEIASEIIPSTVLMLQSKYGRFVVKRMMKYGNSEIRKMCIKALYGNAVKLTSHAVSASVFEYAYSTFASPTDKVNLIQEFFGDMYKQTKDQNVKHLRDVYKDSKDIKAAALSATKANLARILNKDMLDSGLVQTVIAQFLDECSVDDRAEMISLLTEHVVVLSNSKDGARAAMNCFWHGTNKDRKTIMKTIKEHIIDMCKHEHAHTAIICLLDSADDTVLLNKTMLSEILKYTDELIADDWGRRVLAWIVAPAVRRHFHPQFIQELSEGREHSTCKKDVLVRRKEVLDYCIKSLVEKIAEEPKTWCSDAKRLLVTAAILMNESAYAIAAPAFQSVAQLLIDPEFKIDDKIFIENGGCNMTIKKLIQNDTNIKGENTFGSAITSVLSADVILSWITLNRGCFLLADIYANNNESTQTQLKQLLNPHLKLLKTLTTKGAEILLKKLA